MPYAAHRPCGKKTTELHPLMGPAAVKARPMLVARMRKAFQTGRCDPKNGLWSPGIGMRRPIAQGLNGYFQRLQPSL